MMRTEGIHTPVLILSALGDVDEKVKGLRAGGDDYLAKPYAFAELLARIERLARRQAAEPQPDAAAHRRSRDGSPGAHRHRAPASPFCCSRASSSCWNI